jgi:CHAD domain-containing protein
MTRQQEIRFPTPDETTLDKIAVSIRNDNRLLEESAYSVVRTFVDSFDWRLHSGGVTLWAEQKDGNTRICQNGIPKAPTISRFVTTGLTPVFPVDLPPGAIQKTVAKLLGVRVLLPQVEVESRVSSLRLLDAEEKTVLRVLIERSGSRVPGKGKYVPCGSSIRLLPVRGYPKPFARISKILRDEFGLSTAGDSLFEQALRVIGREAGGYSSKLSFSFDSQMRSDLAAKQIHLYLLDIVEANIPGVKADLDSEFLHDMRVAVRRTRSALTQIKGVFFDDEIDKFKSRLAWVGQVTGSTRDMDVYLLGFDNYQNSLPKRFRQDLDPLYAFLEEHQKVEHQILVKKINSPHFRKLLKEWRIFLKMPVKQNDLPPNAATPIVHLANKRIYKMFELVLKQGLAITAKSPAEDLHELRKDCKKLRYLIEFFQALYPAKKVSLLIKPLKNLLDNLGNFQDLEVQADKIREYARQMVEQGETPHDTLLAMGMLVDSLLRRQQQVRIEFAERFASFSNPKNQGIFQTLFASETKRGKG